MRKSLLLIFFAGFFISPVVSQTVTHSNGVKYSKSITAKELREHLEIVASDSMEGRETGKKGQKMAADYLVRNFASMGIKPVGDSSYIQEFPLLEQENTGIIIQSYRQSLLEFEDFYTFNSFFNDSTIQSNAIFAGYGLQGDYDSLSVDGSIVVLYSGSPSADSAVWEVKDRIANAKEKGAAGVFVITDDFFSNMLELDNYLHSKRLWLNTDELQTSAPVFYIPMGSAGKIFRRFSLKKALQQPEKVEAQKIMIHFRKPTEEMSSENVLAYIPGSDLAEELLVITAHYDHLGMKDSLIYNGADDDGSGTVALLEIAEAFMLAKKDGEGPRRSILIMPVSGEEKGLLGSKYYSDNPVFPLEQTVANLNIDMIGRIDKKHEGNPNYIYLIGSDRLSQDLHDISKEVAEKHFNIELDYTYNDPKDRNRFYYRSDHYNFAKHNIPVIFYFNGVHEDYHKPTDTVEKINFEKVENISRLIFLTAWEIANRDEKPKLNQAVEN